MSGLLIGYARVSTDEQDLTAQRDALAALGVPTERVYVDHGLTGAHRDRRRAELASQVRVQRLFASASLLHDRTRRWPCRHSLSAYTNRPSCLSPSCASRTAASCGRTPSTHPSLPLLARTSDGPWPTSGDTLGRTNRLSRIDPDIGQVTVTLDPGNQRPSRLVAAGDTSA